MDYNDIKNLLNEITKTDITHLNLEIDNVKIQLERNSVSNTATTTLQHTPMVEQTINTPNIVLDDIDTLNGINVLSPIVGTFYKASSPTATPYVKVGQKVKKGDVLYIIEAMKIINEITSEIDGEVLEILVDDNQFVEYNQHIMTIG